MGCSEAKAVDPPLPPPPQAANTLMLKVPPGTPAGATIEAKTPQGATIRCQVPHGLMPGQSFQVQYDPTATGGQGQRSSQTHVPLLKIDETKQLTKSIPMSKLPSYWTNMTGLDDKDSAFDDMVYINRRQHASFDELFKETYFAKATRDRSCPKNTCPKTAGGCPCVQPDGDPGMPKGYVVRSVIRVEDSEMYSKYHKVRTQMHRKHPSPVPSCDPPVQTDVIADRHPETFDPLDNNINEVYLWHGTSVRAALSIAANDFKVNLAGSSTGTMYGRGTYLAECCTKADEYAQDEPGGYYNGIFALLLCRVILGKFYYTEKRDEEAGSKVSAGQFDSTVGDRLKSAGTFREFVVYNSDQVYPEYVILYSRIHNADSQRKIDILSKSHFHMQLPIYWSNCYKNPLTDAFHEQYYVRRQTQVLLQKLLEACFKNRKVKIVHVIRVENSSIWISYIKFKQKLLELCGGVDSTDRFKTPNELDGKPESGHLLTHTYLKDENVEQSISISNLEERVNECMLWHGTTRAAAEKIAVSDFHIPKGTEMRAAARFGNGAYFSEELEPALCNCDVSNDPEKDLKAVLLCRVLCGDIYYTEQHTEIDAGQRRDQKGKHSVLGNPEGKGPREFIVPSADQVYPEFIVLLQAPGWVAPAREEARKVNVQIQVPEGFRGGMKLKMQTPDGRQVDVLLPEGVVPGQTVQMKV